MLIDKIINAENNFAEVQSNVIEKPYGRIFYDQSNPLSYDSNHAFIKERSDLEFAINDIVNFYRSLAIIPRVYTFTRNKSIIGQYLKNFGFKQSIEEVGFFIQENKKTIDIPKTIDFQRINHIDETVVGLLSSDTEQGEWGYKALKQSINEENFYVFGGYDSGELTCIASLYKQNDISRINDVFTKKDKRGLGYGSQLINLITNLNDTILHTTSYLYANNPKAINIYKKAGYEEMNGIIRGCYWLE